MNESIFLPLVVVSQIRLFPLQNLVMQHVDHSAGDLIDLLQGLLMYDPSNRHSSNGPQAPVLYQGLPQ